MELEKLQLNLRPRSNRQALDLGFTLLRLDARNVYLAWLALILPWGVLIALLVGIFPEHAAWLWILLWWPLPMFERAPLYVLGRSVFGEEVSWQQAVRAWPRQLRGGMLRMMTIGRLNAARGLYHAIWQFEGASGHAATDRKRLLGRSETSSSAFWYGVLCACFIVILQVGIVGLVGVFVPQVDGSVDPFALMLTEDNWEGQGFAMALNYFAYVLGLCIIGPIFVACSFTLYLNRRATLEAWDLEIALRQIKPPHRAVKTKTNLMLALLLGSFLSIAPSPHLEAKPASSTGKEKPANLDKCSPPPFIAEQIAERQAPLDAQQEALRKEVEKIMAAPDVRPYQCEERMVRKSGSGDKAYTHKHKDATSPVDMVLGTGIKIVLIALLVGLVLWIAFRYRHQVGDWFVRREREPAAIEVGGLDIRPESLPPNVTEKVRQLWQDGDRRGALALLYRATLSRLVQQDNLYFSFGATEGDCLSVAAQANSKQLLSRERLDLTRICTQLWRDAAYGERWPQTEMVLKQCTAWQNEFGVTKLEEVA